jgi:hypothetical protein
VFMKSFKYIFPLLFAGLLTSSQGQTAATVTTPVASASVSAPTAPSNLAYGVTQVLKLQQGGLGKDVLVNYVNSANMAFALRADDIIYLHQVGVPEEVITAMMDKERSHATIAQTQAPIETQQVQYSSQVNPPAPQVSAPTTVVTQPPVVYTTPSYVYNYPSYPYYGGYGYGWGVPLSLSFGFGWGGHYHSGWGGGYHGGGGWHGGGGGHHH